MNTFALRKAALPSTGVTTTLATACATGLAAACLFASAPAAAATLSALNLARPEGVRHVLLATPERHTPGKRALVILLHGHGGSAAQLLGQGRGAAPLSVWLHIAEREQLLLAAPDGVNGQDGKTGWNDCRADAPNNPKTDDTGLIGALIDKAVAEYDVDPARVYVMGMSNGGMMAYRLAAEIAPRLAGFAAVSASMAAKNACAPATVALPALIIAGTADPIVPYGGGDVRFSSLLRSRGTVLPVEESAASWRALANLPAAPASSDVAHRDHSDPTHATRLLWGADPRKVQVELLRIDKGGHVEPSMTKRFGWIFTQFIGKQNGDIEAAEEAWSFFKDKRAGLQPVLMAAPPATPPAAPPAASPAASHP
ncbi:MAG: PHB depolymerase family esterase [Pseudomonadota bacterium]